MESCADQVAREDLLMFLQACFACTGQREFYDEAQPHQGQHRQRQHTSAAFLHAYILGNYRHLYARCLALGINHFNQAQIILNLLATGKSVSVGYRTSAHYREEGALIATALRRLPTHRAWGVLANLQKRRINNRRARAIARDYLAERSSLDFEAVKYQRKVKATIAHSHLNLAKALSDHPTPHLASELSPFLFQMAAQKHFQTPLLESCRQAHYAAEAVYRLPLAIAEGFAAKHRIPHDRFLARMAESMTRNEKLRYQKTATEVGVRLEVDWQNYRLTQLALYILSLPISERLAQRQTFEAALTQAAQRVWRHHSLPTGRIAAVLDNSFSSSGSSEKRRRPLGVALASHYLFKTAVDLAASSNADPSSLPAYRAFWTEPPSEPLSEPLAIAPRGATDLATPLLAALAWKPDWLVIVSDGYDNNPLGGAAEVLRVWRTQLDPKHRVAITHGNPVLSSNDFAPKSLSPWVPTLGLRDAEDWPLVLSLAQIAAGENFAVLEVFLAAEVERFLGGVGQH